MEDRNRLKASVAMLSVVSNSILVLLKLVVGLMIGSVSIISEAIHSGMDLAAAVIALFAVKKAGKPADASHPFGHGKVENVSGTVEAGLIFLAAAWIIYEAVHKLVRPVPLEAPGWGVAVMLVSAAANLAVSHMLFKIGRETDSAALKADAWHLRTDVYTSVGVMVGLALIWIGERMFPGTNLHWIDPAAAIGVALLIMKAAYDLTVESCGDLFDRSLPDDEVDTIQTEIQKFAALIRGFHGVRTRKSGADRFLEFHLMVDKDLSVHDSHEIADDITRAIQAHFPAIDVNIHVEPCDTSCEPECLDGCLLAEDLRRALRQAGGV